VISDNFGFIKPNLYISGDREDFTGEKLDSGATGNHIYQFGEIPTAKSLGSTLPVAQESN
jgi:hypothetical protein